MLRFAIKTLDNKLKDGRKAVTYVPGTIMDYASVYGQT